MLFYYEINKLFNMIVLHVINRFEYNFEYVDLNNI